MAEESADRARVIVYLALCELRDLDPAGEPEHFTQTRRDLHAWLDGDEPPRQRDRGHLQLVAPTELDSGTLTPGDGGAKPLLTALDGGRPR